MVMKKIKTALLKLGQLLKRVFKRKPKYFQIFKRHRWLFISLTFILLVVTYLLVAILSISPARIKLSEFKKIISTSGPCHEDCLLYRKQLKNELTLYFKQSKRFQENVRQLFLTNDTHPSSVSDLNFKKELLEIMAAANGAGNPPDFIADYFLSAEAQPELKAEIIKLFLASTANPDLGDYYFSILDSEEAVVVKTEAVKALSTMSDKRACFKVENIYLLQDLILNSKESLSLKADLIFLLSDFDEFFPTESQQALMEIFQNSSQNIVKAFVADTLNNLGFMEYNAPSVTDTEWTAYFNN